MSVHELCLTVASKQHTAILDARMSGCHQIKLQKQCNHRTFLHLSGTHPQLAISSAENNPLLATDL